MGIIKSEKMAQAIQVEQGKQDILGGILGGVSDFLGGIGGWAKENPALFTGFTTGILGATQGLGGLESMAIGGQAGMNTQQGVMQVNKTNAEIAANKAKSLLDQQKLLLEIEQAKQTTRQGDIDAALKAKQAEQEVINSAYKTATDMFPKDPKAAADYAQKLIMQKTKGGQVSVGNKAFGLFGSRPITYTPSQPSNFAMQ